MVDTRTGEEVEYIEFETQAAAPAARAALAAQNLPMTMPGRYIALNENAPETVSTERYAAWCTGDALLYDRDQLIKRLPFDALTTDVPGSHSCRSTSRARISRRAPAAP